MSTLDINAIRDYLLKVGCKIEYPILVHSFRKHLYNPDPNVQAKLRTQFKDHVNRLATVSLENNMKFINLRPEFRPPNFEAQQQQQQQSIPQQVAMEAKISPPKQNQHHHLQKQIAIQSPYTPPRSAQPVRPPAPLQQQQQQQTTPPPPLPPQHRGINAQQQQQQQQYQPILSNQSAVLMNHQTHQRQLSLQHQQTLEQHQSTPRQLNQIQRQLSLSSPVATKPNHDVQDGFMSPAAAAAAAAESMPPPPPPPPLATRRQQLSLQRPESLNLTTDSNQMPPPRPPPRRRQSTASLFKPSPKPIEKLREIHDLAKRSPGRVKEHALKLNSFNLSTSDLNALQPMHRSNTMKENRLSRDSTLGGSLSSALQRNGSHLTTRSRSSHREDESDSSSLQPIDPLRRKWAIEACNCNYNGLLTLLREDPKLAAYKDIVNGYTALHWAAKFGNLDIIKLIAGTHSVSANIKSSAGYTPLHVAYLFNRNEAANLLLKSYKANPDIRDHSGKRPVQYCRAQTQAASATK